MLDFETIIQIFFIVFAAMALFAGVWTIADNFDTWNDFFKIFKDKGDSYLSFVFRKGKHLRFITYFPADLRNACLEKNSFYMETEEDDEKNILDYLKGKLKYENTAEAIA